MHISCPAEPDGLASPPPAPCPGEHGDLCHLLQGRVKPSGAGGSRTLMPPTYRGQAPLAPCSLRAPTEPFSGRWASCTALPVTPATVAEQGTGHPMDSCCHPKLTHSLTHAGLHRCACALRGWCCEHSPTGGFGKGGPPVGHPPALGAQQDRAAGSPRCRQHRKGTASQPLPEVMHPKRGSRRRGAVCQQGLGSPQKHPANSPCLHSHPQPQRTGQSTGYTGKSWQPPCRRLRFHPNTIPSRLGAWAGAPAAGPGRAEDRCVSKGLSRLLIRWWRKHLGLPPSRGAPGRRAAGLPTSPAPGSRT